MLFFMCTRVLQLENLIQQTPSRPEFKNVLFLLSTKFLSSRRRWIHRKCQLGLVQMFKWSSSISFGSYGLHPSPLLFLPDPFNPLSPSARLKALEGLSTLELGTQLSSAQLSSANLAFGSSSHTSTWTFPPHPTHINSHPTISYIHTIIITWSLERGR